MELENTASSVESTETQVSTVAPVSAPEPVTPAAAPADAKPSLAETPPPDPRKASRREIVADAMARAKEGSLQEMRSTRRGVHAAQQPRAQDGKFVPTAAEKAAGITSSSAVNGTGSQMAAKLVQGAVAAETAAAPVTTKPLPQSWEAKFSEKWQKLDPEIQAQIEKREQDAYRGLDQYKQGAAFAKEVQRTLQPFMGTIQQLGVSPTQAIEKLLNADHVLRYSSPQQKQQFFLQLAQQYQVPLTEQDMQMAVQQHAAAPPALTQKIANLEAQLNQYQQLTQQTIEQAQIAPYQGEVQQFAMQPGHEHFEQLRPIMAALLEQAASENKPMSLQQAYDEAKWAHPQLREGLIGAQRESFLKSQAEQAQRSRQAAVQVRGAPSAGAVTTVDPKDRRSIIANALRAASSH